MSLYYEVREDAFCKIVTIHLDEHAKQTGKLTLNEEELEELVKASPLRILGSR